MKYKDYLRSEHWKLIRGAKLQVHPVCQRCESKTEIEVHHKVYRDSWYDTKICDLETLCHHCHTLHHAKQYARKELTHKQIQKSTKVVKPGKQIKHNHNTPSRIPNIASITWLNKERFTITKESYAWLAEKGLRPDLVGWRKRIVGHVCPSHFLR
jgi:hypothetical protein